MRPEDVVNLPLNQYRNYQYLMNLVPGATPPEFQNAQTDTPARSLSVNINGTNRNNNVTRIDGAASINVWLPHHAGYIAPVETIENVNISTNSFDSAQGMTGGAATSVQTKSGTNTFKGSAFFFRQQDELNARRGYFDPSKVDASTSIIGGTVGGPIRRNKLFYFGSWERNAERQGIFNTYTVPTAKMRNGDFSEVLALNSNFRIYDPATGTSTGADRSFFDNAIIPANRISDIAKKIQALYPEPNNPGTNNGLQNNLYLPRNPKADRDNYDFKVNWNRTTAHQIWGKFSMMQASVFDLFYLPFDAAGGGDTRTMVFTGGQTWTLTPTLLFDANVGVNGMQQNFQGPDYGTNYGSEVWGIPGLNVGGAGGPGSFDLNRYSGMPQVETGLAVLGNNSTWTPVWRDERSYTASANLTKVAGRHELRTGFDFIRLRLNHWQPEVSNPRGILTFGGGVTGTPGYSGVGGWNGYAAFLLGQMSSFNKSIQYEELSGRENQYAVYVADRWQVNPKFTVNLGLRYEYYPLMTRQDRGIELLDLNTLQRQAGRPGRQPDRPRHQGQQHAVCAPPGRRLPSQREDGVARGIWQDLHTAALVEADAWPLPADDRVRRRWCERLHPVREYRQRHPVGAKSRSLDRKRAAASRRRHDHAGPERRHARRHAVLERVHRTPAAARHRRERRLRRHTHRRAVHHAERQLRGNWRQCQQAAVRTGRYCDHQRLREHSEDALPLAPDGGESAVQEWLHAQRGVHAEQAMNEVEDDGGGYTWAQPSQFSRNYALANSDRTHVLQVGFVYELPFGTRQLERRSPCW